MICVVRVARYRIVSKCFYAFLFRRPRGEKYRNTLGCSRSPTMLKHSSSHFYYRVSNSFQPLTPIQSPLQSALYPARPKMLSIIASSVSPDTVSLLNVFFYLGVREVKNIATTVYGDRGGSSSLDCKHSGLPPKGRYGTTRLSQPRARGSIRQ